MKLKDFLERVKDIDPEFEMLVMQETDFKTTGRHQIQSGVTDIATVRNELIIIGQELDDAQ